MCCVFVSYFFVEIIGIWMNLVLVIVYMFIFCMRKEVILEYLFVFWFGLIIGMLVVIEVNMRFLKFEDKRKKKSLVKKIKKFLVKNYRNGILKFFLEMKKRYVKNV